MRATGGWVIGSHSTLRWLCAPAKLQPDRFTGAYWVSKIPSSRLQIPGTRGIAIFKSQIPGKAPESQILKSKTRPASVLDIGILVIEISLGFGVWALEPVGISRLFLLPGLGCNAG